MSENHRARETQRVRERVRWAGRRAGGESWGRPEYWELRKEQADWKKLLEGTGSEKSRASCDNVSETRFRKRSLPCGDEGNAAARAKERQGERAVGTRKRERAREGAKARARETLLAGQIEAGQSLVGSLLATAHHLSRLPLPSSPFIYLPPHHRQHSPAPLGPDPTQLSLAHPWTLSPSPRCGDVRGIGFRVEG